MWEVFNRNRNIIYAVLLVIFISTLVYIVSIQTVLGGVNLTSFNSTSPVESAIVKNGDKNTIINSEHYFVNKSWAIATISSGGGDAFIVLQKSDGFWHIVLGPGTSFSNSSTQDIPLEVVQYLDSQKGGS